MYLKTITGKDRKELQIFLAVAYGLTFLMGIPMALFFHMGKDVALFASAQMFYPAAGLMLAKLICQKEDPSLPKHFFIGFLILSGIEVLWCFAGFFLPDLITSEGSSYSAAIGTVVIGILYFSEKKERRNAYGLAGKKWGLSLCLLALFIALVFVRYLLCTVITEGSSGLREFLLQMIDQNQLFIFVNLPVAFVLSASSYLGEEYGWRTYFQPLLQKKFGLIKGVFLFGVLWEFWHLPLVFFYYAPLAPNMSLVQLIVLRYVSCVLLSIFMAYAYMKTHNVWLPVLIHFANNVLAGTETKAVTWTTLMITILLLIISYLPFLSFKVFRNQDTEQI